MAAEKIGSVKGGKSYKSFTVYWNPSSGEVYVDISGKTYVGKASSAGQAMRMAEAAVYNK
ncbi:hypothetical protein D9V86_10005 [Bacteroidetes/Chlorobi group bacterium ChocPot_Mid]|nr:MAG: hypothetical protein D9V86_10005 [Bacteroidetes/Chlorobi group bacterium ChocPot_Mid]